MSPKNYSFTGCCCGQQKCDAPSAAALAGFRATTNPNNVVDAARFASAPTMSADKIAAMLAAKNNSEIS